MIICKARQCSRALPSALASRRVVAAGGCAPVVQKCRAAMAISSSGRNHYTSLNASSWRGMEPTVLASPCYRSRRFLSSLPPHDVVGMPALSPTMEVGTITEWKAKEGSVISAGDIICCVETDKTTVDFEAQDEAVLAKILVPAGTEVKVGSPIMVTCEDEKDVGAFASFSPEAAAAPVAKAPAAKETTPPPPPPSSPPAAPSTPPAAAASSSASDPKPAGGRVFASPLARKLAGDKGYELSDIEGTGPGGRIIAADVKEHQPSARTEAVREAAAPAAAGKAEAPSKPAKAAAAAAGVPGEGFVDVPVSDVARQIAEKLTATKQTVPHYCLTMDIKLDALLAVRAQLNEGLAEEDKLSLNDMLLKAAALAMKKVPDVNAAWMESFVRQFHSVDMNLMVGVGDGMVAPVVKDVGGRGLLAVSREVKALAKAAQASSLAAEQCATGTFSVLNVGMYGVKSVTPIINAPQSCILALGVAAERVMPNEDPESEEIYQLNQMMTASLTCDHRVVDGAVGAQWMSAFKGLVEDPMTMLL